jgi:Co/Zn/Cd efflux system component
VILRWAWMLIRDTSSVLLDRIPDDALAKTIRTAVEGEGDARVTDLHLWQVGPGRFAAIVAIAAKDPADAALYKARIGCDPRIVHITVEVVRA